MPIIFAQAIMFIPLTLAGFGSRGEASSIVKALTNMEGFWYNFIYFLMIVAFTYFYTAITVRPTQMSEDMKRNNGFIPGVKPGKKTADYLTLSCRESPFRDQSSWVLLRSCRRSQESAA